VICSSLKSYFDSNSGCALHLYCEIPRDLPLRKHFDALKAFTSEPSIAPRLKVYCSNSENATLLTPFASVDVAVLPPGLNPMHYPKIPAQAARDALSIKEGDFSVLAIGRIDTGVLMFADFVQRHPALNARLILPIDQNLKDTVVEMYVNELASRGLDPKEYIKNLILLRDIGFMSLDEVNIIFHAADVVVHVNPVADYNSLTRICAIVGTPQVIPAIPNNVSNIDTNLVKLVDAPFEFYIFDEYGGKMRLCGHHDMADALNDVLVNFAKYESKSKQLIESTSNEAKTALAWDNWKRAFVPAHHHQHDPAPCPPPDHHHHYVPSPVPAPPPYVPAPCPHVPSPVQVPAPPPHCEPRGGADYSSEINDLKQKLADILLAFNAK
jgi:hypothetical protein